MNFCQLCFRSFLQTLHPEQDIIIRS
uniref:Uncharacterized protein n=1 Tax=Anguilla anguilla TaxID=7936 RepID=A0A0E9UXV9_ANGAN